ncbi:MAG: aldehyde ferredoxin oxidoreductase family protein [Candidatus Nezhaarchaeales archaeon]
MAADRYLSRVLTVDLTSRRFQIEEREDLFEKYLGGVGVAIQLLKEACPKGADPLGPDNVIVLAVGPLTGLFPLASKTVALFKSPLTGNLGESHAGGRSAIAIKSAGYGAIVIKGVSRTPVYLSISMRGVEFKDASGIWGVRSSFTVGRVIRELELGAGVRTIMRIGRAGEKLIAFASVITETYRHFGRLGLGAVFGSKKLKAIVVRGNRSIPVTDPNEYRKLYEEIYRGAVESAVMKKYHDLGTAANVLPLNELKALPTRNLKNSYFEGAQEVSGENLAEKYLSRRVACAHCPVACIHLAALREPYLDIAYFYKTVYVGYDYELIYALGSMLGVSNAHGLLKLIDEVDTVGLDAISTGVSLAWATEAFERGLITEHDLLGVRLRWGDWKAYVEAVKLLVERANGFYDTLANGVEEAAAKYGGFDYALTFAGNEMPGYHTGPAAYIGYLTGARHSHLDGAGYSIDEAAFKKGEKLTPRQIAELLLNEEAWRQILSSLVVCFFARGLYKPEVVVKALGTAGFQLSMEQLKNLGFEILKVKQAYKIQEGFNPETLKVPRRVEETPSPQGPILASAVKEGVRYYFELLGVQSHMKEVGQG